MCHSDNNFIEKLAGPINDVQMSVGDGIKATGINRASDHWQTWNVECGSASRSETGGEIGCWSNGVNARLEGWGNGAMEYWSNVGVACPPSAWRRGGGKR